jgi:hypothetical protein
METGPEVDTRRRAEKRGGKHMASKARRTTHRSSTDTKLYAVRDAQGRFKDIQTYKRAHGADLKRRAKPESARKTGKK